MVKVSDYYEILRKERESCISEKRHHNHNVDHLIASLSAGAIVLSITFTQLVFTSVIHVWMLMIAWVFFMVAVTAVVLSGKTSARNYECQIGLINESMAIESKGESKASNIIINKYQKKISMLSRNTDLLDMVSLASFSAGSVLFLLFAAVNLLK